MVHVTSLPFVGATVDFFVSSDMSYTCAPNQILDVARGSVSGAIRKNSLQRFLEDTLRTDDLPLYVNQLSGLFILGRLSWQQSDSVSVSNSNMEMFFFNPLNHCVHES